MLREIPEPHISLYSRITANHVVTDILDCARGPALRKLFSFLKKHAMQAHARCAGKAFYCNALNGTSAYNISINSDMTVSCNCQDDYNEGTIGDLSRNSFHDIFHGPATTAMRRKLAAGVLPLRTCSRCFELRTAGKREAAQKADHPAPAPGGIMVENTSACNQRCIGCNRKSIVASRRSMKMSMDDIRKVSQEIRENGIKKIFFFKYGEPFLSPAVYEELKTIKEQNPGAELYISTNGSVIESQQQRKAALFADHIYFSIDGVSDYIVDHYQRGGSFTKAYENMKAVVSLRNESGRKKPVIEWKYVLFNWNDRPEMISAARELAVRAGVDVISFWPTNAPYYGKSLRYYLSPFFTRETVKQWTTRELWFTEAPSR